MSDAPASSSAVDDFNLNFLLDDDDEDVDTAAHPTSSPTTTTTTTGIHQRTRSTAKAGGSGQHHSNEELSFTFDDFASDAFGDIAAFLDAPAFAAEPVATGHTAEARAAAVPPATVADGNGKGEAADPSTSDEGGSTAAVARGGAVPPPRSASFLHQGDAEETFAFLLGKDFAAATPGDKEMGVKVAPNGASSLPTAGPAADSAHTSDTAVTMPTPVAEPEQPAAATATVKAIASTPEARATPPDTVGGEEVSKRVVAPAARTPSPPKVPLDAVASVRQPHRRNADGTQLSPSRRPRHHPPRGPACGGSGQLDAVLDQVWRLLDESAAAMAAQKGERDRKDGSNNGDGGSRKKRDRGTSSAADAAFTGQCAHLRRRAEAARQDSLNSVAQLQQQATETLLLLAPHTGLASLLSMPGATTSPYAHTPAVHLLPMICTMVENLLVEH